MYLNFACSSLKKHHHCMHCVPFIYTYIHFVGVFLPRDLRKWIRGWTYHWILWARRWAWIWWRNFTSLEWRGPTRNDAGFKWTNTRTSTSTTKIKPSQPTSSLPVLFHFVLASCYSCKRFSSWVASYIFGKVPANFKIMDWTMISSVIWCCSFQLQSTCYKRFQIWRGMNLKNLLSVLSV